MQIFTSVVNRINYLSEQDYSVLCKIMLIFVKFSEGHKLDSVQIWINIQKVTDTCYGTKYFVDIHCVLSPIVEL